MIQVELMWWPCRLACTLHSHGTGGAGVVAAQRFSRWTTMTHGGKETLGGVCHAQNIWGHAGLFGGFGGPFQAAVL